MSEKKRPTAAVPAARPTVDGVRSPKKQKSIADTPRRPLAPHLPRSSSVVQFLGLVEPLVNRDDFYVIMQGAVLMKKYEEAAFRQEFLDAAREIIRILDRYGETGQCSAPQKAEILFLLRQLVPEPFLKFVEVIPAALVIEATATISMVPTVCRLHALEFLGLEDLANVALTSKQFNGDCRHPSQRNKLVPVIHFSPGRGGSMVSLMRMLITSQTLTPERIDRFRRVRIDGANRFQSIFTKDAKRIAGGVQLPGIVSLDLSLSPHVQKRSERKVFTSIPGNLAFVFPNLREVDLSHTHIANKALIDFSKRCPLLEKVTWHRQDCSIFLQGHDLEDAKHLKEIHMDGSNFYSSDKMRQYYTLHLNHHVKPSNFLFYACARALERVSIRNASCHPFGLPPVDVPQSALIKFVRWAPSLCWFRSNLSQENMAMLRVERPGIELLN